MSSHARAHDPVTDTGDEVAFSWTEPSPWVRSRLVRNFPLRRLLPDEEPSYVSSLLYVMGVLTLAALIVVILSGVVLALGGVQWWQTSSVGGFMNSVHFWGVQLFFLFMVVHLWGKYWMAAWRGKRALTWATGVLAFLTAVGVGFTGYVITTNFNAQWIAFEAKDVMNAIGVGSVFNVTNLGQMVTFHVAPLPLVLVAIVAMHVLLVRRHGVVPPIDAIDHDAVAAADTTEATS